MENKKRVNISQRLMRAYRNNNRCDFLRSLYNDFEIVVEEKYPIIKRTKQLLMAFGAEGSMMSGSGSTIFGIFSSKNQALVAKNNIKKYFKNFFVEMA